MAAGRFRADLKFRIVGDRIHVPGLGERREDVPVLAEDWLRRNHPDRQLGASAAAYLEARAWPGNVRELEWLLARAVAYTDALRLERRHVADEEPPSRRELLLSGRVPLPELAARLGRSEREARGLGREAMAVEERAWGSARAAARAWGCARSTWMTRKRWALPEEPTWASAGRRSAGSGPDHLWREIDE